MTSHKSRGTAHTVEFRVRYAETDQMQVVYHSNYLVWCEIGRIQRVSTRVVLTRYIVSLVPLLFSCTGE